MKKEKKIKTKINTKKEIASSAIRRKGGKFWVVCYSVFGTLLFSAAAFFISFNFPNQFEPFASQIFKLKPILVGGSIVFPTDTPTPTFTPTNTPTFTPTFTPTPVPPTATPIPYVAPAAASSAKMIDINLSSQSLTAYENGQVILSTLISTGIPGRDTPTGTFYVQSKIESELMAGPGYYLPGVPYTQYFYGSYALHGTYWHSNFGQTMSHGCVNLPTWAAEQLYYWDDSSTPIVIHY